MIRDILSDAFLANSFRCITRWSQYAKIFNDNGINFVRAYKMLKICLKTINRKTNERFNIFRDLNLNLNLMFIPHFGRLWKSGVKSTKPQLTRLVKAETVLNPRPMTSISSDTEDYVALTHNTFSRSNHATI